MKPYEHSSCFMGGEGPRSKKKKKVCYAFLLWKARVTRHFERTAVATYRSQARFFFFFPPALSVPGTLLYS